MVMTTSYWSTKDIEYTYKNCVDKLEVFKTTCCTKIIKNIFLEGTMSESEHGDDDVPESGDEEENHVNTTDIEERRKVGTRKNIFVIAL